MNVGTLTDEQLAKNCSNKVAWQELYNRHRGYVLNISKKYLVKNDLAEDITADIFANLPILTKGAAIRNFKNWLYSTTKNKCIHYLKEVDKYAHTDYTSEDLRTDDNKVDEPAHFRDFPEQFNLLKREQRACLLMHYIGKCSYQEIAEELNLTFNKVKSHVQNGKRKLRLTLLENTVNKIAS